MGDGPGGEELTKIVQVISGVVWRSKGLTSGHNRDSQCYWQVSTSGWGIEQYSLQFQFLNLSECTFVIEILRLFTVSMVDRSGIVAPSCCSSTPL